MPYFHSCTGCDTTSSFFKMGKKTAWEAWKSYPDVTTAFATIALDPFLDFNRQSPQIIIWSSSEIYISPVK